MEVVKLPDYCDFIADEGHFLTGAQIYVHDPGINNHLEYLVEQAIAFGANPARDPFDKLWRGVFGYVSWGWKLEAGDLRLSFKEPSFINWYNTYFEPEYDRFTACRIWIRKKVHANVTIFQSNPLEVGGTILTPGVVLN